jgi:anti-sigma regulatory factor (Ser/Thr protein kinase)
MHEEREPADARHAQVHLHFPPTSHGFAHAFDELRHALTAEAVGRQATYACELVFEEIVTNILKHACLTGPEHEIAVTLDLAKPLIVMRFEDDGRPFDPSRYPLHQPDRDLLTTRDGGRGLALVRRAVRSLEYERTLESRNRLTATVDAADE